MAPSRPDFLEQPRSWPSSGSGRLARPGLVSRLAIALLLLGCLLPPVLCAENPAGDMFKHDATNSSYGQDPQGNSWVAMQNSFQQFLHPEFILRLALSFTLAVVCGWLVAWHPRRSRRKALSDLEERKTLILLGMVGAVIAELSGTNQTLAFVIFGIGALLRFRTLLDNPKLTGKAITVVVIGLACGMGSWAMAVFVTLFAWILLFWLDSQIACRIRVRLADDVAPAPVVPLVQKLLLEHRCQLQSTALNQEKRELEFLLHIPAALDLGKLEADLRATLPNPDSARIKFKLA
jgi:hypothetical protein